MRCGTARSRPCCGRGADQIQVARGYAYGGCVIQDLGYYPFGSKFFSNPLHYVR